MSKFTHQGFTVSHNTNDIGNTVVWVYLGPHTTLNAVRDTQGEVYSVTLSLATNDTLWFGEFTMESNTPGHAQVQLAPWLPFLQPIFAKIPLVGS